MKQEFADQVRATDEKLKQLQLEVSQVSMSMGIRPGSAAAPKREQIKVNF